MVYFPKRLQVFVSSTYLDLIEERQAAVQAILEAKHIPAGMELFTAGDQSQWEVIKHWIDQSDVYLLILGGRYGSIDQKTQKSYTHLEYEYALRKKIPSFSCVLKYPDKRANEKDDFTKYIERDNFTKYQEFRTLATSNRVVKFWESSNDIEKAIILTLKDFERREDIIGWVRGETKINSTLIAEEKAKLTEKNQELEELLEGERNTYNEKLIEIESQQKQLEQSYQIKINQLQQQLSEKDSRINQLQEQIQELESFVQNNKTEEIQLKSEKGIDYTKLRKLLATGEWKEADRETTNIILQVIGKDFWWKVTTSDVDNFPCDDLRTINQLWVKYSKGKFGFSVQKKIYIDELGGTRNYNREIWQEFCDRVGWRKAGKWLIYSNLTFELLDTTPRGHLPRNVVVGISTVSEGWKVFSLVQRLVTCKI